jgi:hypothetical protein
VIIVAQSQNATIVMGLSFLMTIQLSMRFALWPDRIEDHAPGTRGRLEFLLQEVLRGDQEHARPTSRQQRGA